MLRIIVINKKKDGGSVRVVTIDGESVAGQDYETFD